MLAFLFEMFVAVSVYSLPLKKRIPVWLWWTITASVAVLFPVLDWLTTGYIPSAIMNLQFGPLLQAALLMLSLGFLCALFILYLEAMCAVSFSEAIYCFSCAYLMEHVAYCSCNIAKAIFPAFLFTAGQPLYFLLTGIIYLIYYLAFARRMAENGHYDTTVALSLNTTIITLVIVLVLSILASIFEFELFHSIYAILACVLVLSDQVRAQKELKLQKELGVQRELWLKNKTQYETAKETIEIINRKSHDLKHQIGALRSMNDEQRRESALAEIEQSVFVYDAMLKTGNEILDTVLTEKSLICNDEGIELNCVADGAAIGFMDAIDLYTLFGNALDNAIEAQRKMPEGARHIDLRVASHAGLVLVQVQNPYAIEPIMRDGVPETSKPNMADHGYGVRSMMDIADSYGGFASVTAKDRLFTLRVTFPEMQNTPKNKQAAAKTV